MQPFEVRWDAQQIDRLRERLTSYRYPDQPLGDGWRYGCDPQFLREACAHWANGYDFAAAQVELNRYPQFTAEIGGHSIHFVHVVGEAGGKRPLLLIHGWPASPYEFWPAVEALAFPSRNGGEAADAFDLVIPSLPGFAFSSKPELPIGPKAIGGLFDQLMRKVLGYATYLVHGTDWGAITTPWMALNFPDSLKGIHVDMLGVQPPGDPENAAEQAFQASFKQHEEKLGAYSKLQGTRVQSLAFAMEDNPVAQAAWIWERFHDWADLRGRGVKQVFGLDTLITSAMLYVATDRFTTASWIYTAAEEEGARKLPAGKRVEVPTGFASWPDPRHPRVPRTLVERGYDLIHWGEHSKGGHFPPIEEPETFVADLRKWATVCA